MEHEVAGLYAPEITTITSAGKVIDVVPSVKVPVVVVDTEPSSVDGGVDFFALLPQFEKIRTAAKISRMEDFISKIPTVYVLFR
jgi:hypothetical protein